MWQGILFQIYIEKSYRTSSRVKCETCNKEFSDVSYLTKHKRTHSQLGIFPCDQCDKTFKAKAYRKIHIQTIHNRDANKKFKCVSCDKCFIRKNNLKSHIQPHRKQLDLNIYL